MEPPALVSSSEGNEGADGRTAADAQREFAAYLKETRNTICGRHPIGVLLGALSALEQQGTSTELRFTRYEVRGCRAGLARIGMVTDLNMLLPCSLCLAAPHRSKAANAGRSATALSRMHRHLCASSGEALMPLLRTNMHSAHSRARIVTVIHSNQSMHGSHVSKYTTRAGSKIYRVGGIEWRRKEAMVEWAWQNGAKQAIHCILVSGVCRERKDETKKEKTPAGSVAADGKGSATQIQSELVVVRAYATLSLSICVKRAATWTMTAHRGVAPGGLGRA